jgi:uncharacterized membrane protein SpoIIM required for sporulation
MLLREGTKEDTDIDPHMITNRWIEKRKKYWDRMTALLERVRGGGIRGLSGDELREMALLYRQIASDLSAIRQDPSARALQPNLNILLARAHAVIYSGHRTDFRACLRFLQVDYPRLFRRLLPFTLVSLMLFLGGAVLGTLLALARPEFMHTLLGPEMMQTIERHEMWTHSLNSMAPQASSAIMTNNLTVTFTTFAAGITAGVGTLYLIGWNGLLLGVIAAACHEGQMSLKLWSFVAPHGALELPAIVIAGGAGLRLAHGLLFPGIFSRMHSLAVAGAESTRLVAGIVPMLVVAGVLEGFFSPSAAPVALKFLVSGALFTMLALWLFSGMGRAESSTDADGMADPESRSAYKSDFSLISR